ncbi:putative disease resistance RPP13-like protein 1 [Phragmites australis]|uniref:putative disease resistance RPP13-like protein 1 n=1 Tax=Phragmites australis TaxID=29695 RepID=UPI002D792EF7|nr:putative disease resistance RPP13-like protein 1 [Phragmites australis]XP_062187015.1 putative disease resistance RPP13-like protein 1 [Phragmites australis]
MEDDGWSLPAAIGRVVGKLRFYLGNSRDSNKFKGTMKMLDLLEEKLKLLHEENLQRVSVDREDEMEAWLSQVKEAADDAEELVKDMEAELETGESAVPDVITWFHSDSSCLLRMKYTIGRLVSMCTEGESILGLPNMDEDRREAMRNDSTSLSPEHAYVVGREKEIALILEMILDEVRFKAAPSIESWESAESLQVSQKGRIIETLRNVDLSMQRQEDAEVAPDQKEMGSSVEYSRVGNDSEMWNPAIIPIVGMGGVGKTTLAQLIFDDERIQKHFQGQSAWVYFTDNIRKEELMTQILVSLQPQQKILADVLDLKRLHFELQSFIEGKRFLLVFDGVSDEIRAMWSELRSVLRKGAPGSVVLVTTQIYGVASFMGTTTPIFLCPLQHDDLWKVFKHHAFASNQNTEVLESIGRKIADKLHGFPLAATMVGASLRNYLDGMLWDRFLKSWWWNVSSNSLGVHIAASLRVCYCELPAYLRQCLVYCSIFPRNYVFGKYELIQMWIANGFIELNNPAGSRSLEEVAAEWFNELVNRCFLQPTIWKVRYVMHDLVRDFAIALTSNEHCGVDCKLVDLPPNVRHLSVDMDNMNVPWADYNIKRLRSLILFGGEGYRTVDNVLEWPDDTVDSTSEISYDNVDSSSEISYDTVDTISEWSSDTIDIDRADFILRSCENVGIILTTSTSLRLLNLSNMRASAAEACIGDRLLDEDHIALFVKFITRHQMLPRLTHLRYLDFSYSGITELPDSLCSLCNLQVLGLRGCRFTQLPRSMSSLISLRHLHADADTIALIHGIGALTKLQELHEFCVKAEDGHRITELRDMRYIQGPLCISDLQKVVHQAEAIQANLFRKEYVTCLDLKWDRNQSPSGKYNPYRKELKQYDRGQKVPLHASLLEGYYLPSYMSGLIVNSSEVTTPGLAMEILECLYPPRNLQKLKFLGYPGFAFPDWVGQLRYIQVIEIRQCTELQVLPPIGQLEHLRKLKLYELPLIKDVSSDVYGTSNVVFGSLEVLSFESMVKWENWADAGSRKFFPNLQKLQINRCYNLKELPFMALGAAIKVLSLSGCGSYSGTVSSYLHRLTCLTHLKVNDCSHKFVLPCQQLVALEYLHLSNCNALCFEGGILCLNNLKNLHISSCRIITSSLDGETNHMLSNQALRLREEETLAHKTTSLQLVKEVGGKQREIHLPGSPADGLTKESGKKRKEISERASIAGLYGTTKVITRESPQKDEGIHVMQSLTDLTMDNLSLSLNLDNILSKLSALRTLCLYKLHKISVLQEQWLEQIKSLQELEFSCCYFLRKLPSNLFTLSSVKKLSLQSCSRIHSLPSKGLPGNLKELHILGCSPILQARCQKGDGETWAKKKVGEWPKGTIIEHRQEELNEFWQGWLKYEKEWVQCDEEQLKNKGEWLKNEEEDWLKNSAEELENNEDVRIKPTGEDWPKIAHIPYIRVNGDIIQNLYL